MTEAVTVKTDAGPLTLQVPFVTTGPGPRLIPGSDAWKKANSKELVDDQERFFKLQVDFKEPPEKLRESIHDTPIKYETMRRVLRYAHQCLTTAYAAIKEVEDDLTQRGISDNDRGYGRGCEDAIERAAHRDDERWIQRATIDQLTHEIRCAAHERQAMEFSVENLRKVLAGHDDVQRLRAAGRVSKFVFLAGPGMSC